MYLQIKVIPKSQKTEFVERMEDDTLKIRLKATPERGKANEELIRFLAKSLSCATDEIRIISGQTATKKLVRVPDGAKQQVKLLSNK